MSSAVANTIANLFTRPTRTAMPRTPIDYGMPFQDTAFAASDGVALSAWYIPSKDRASQKLAVMNHPLYCSKYGFFPAGEIGKLVPVHVEFMKTARHLHDAGYNVLTYDLRNHGASAQSPTGLSGIGAFEWQDALGAMQYIAQHEQLRGMDVALVNHCMGANAAISAMSRAPEQFTQVRALVAVQPISMRYMANKFIPMLGGDCNLEEVDAALQSLAGIGLKDMSPMPHLKDLTVPVLYSQVRLDALTDPEDVQAIFDGTPTTKELVWIEGELNRFDGYNHFGDHPEKMLRFLTAHMR